MEEQEEVLLALIEHRAKEVEHLRTRIAYYNSQLNVAEKALEETQHQLARLRTRPIATISVKQEETSTSPLKCLFYNNQSQNSQEDSEEDDCKFVKTTKPKPLLVIPSLPKQQHQNQQPKVKKRKLGIVTEKEEEDLIKMVCSSSSPNQIKYETSTQISSQHKRKLRTLVLCPTDDQLFATSALDGIVNLWQIQGKRSHANLVGSINGLSLKQKRWPEDVAWHPHGGSLIAVYTADDGDSQLATLNLNNNGQEEVVFLEDKPHDKGIINNIMFMPWGGFVTCGSDHAVVYWTEKHNKTNKCLLWKPKVLHRSMHSSAVMGVAGMQQKQMLVSVGADKRIIGFDLHSQKPEYKHQIESKCMSVVPNPRDFNLFMVQTGTPERQLRLFDMRVKGWTSQIHEFGWNQESSNCQSALINQCWSPDGLYLTSGSADPMIHIFDIRFNGNQPSQSIKAHQKRVFKAAWHHSYPLLISISSDLNIGLHNII